MPHKKLMESEFKGKSITSQDKEGGVSKPRMQGKNKEAPPGNAANSANPSNPGNLNILKKIKSSPGFKTDI